MDTLPTPYIPYRNVLFQLHFNHNLSFKQIQNTKEFQNALAFLAESFRGGVSLVGVTLVADPTNNVPAVENTALGHDAVVVQRIHHGDVCGRFRGASSFSGTTTASISVRAAELRMLPGKRGGEGGAVSGRVACECLQRLIRHL